MLSDLGNSGPIPALQAMMNFAGRRHALLADNIANVSTPNYQPKNLSTRGFQRQLADALSDRRARGQSAAGELVLKSTREVRQDATGRLVLRPTTPSNNILFHDRNNRDVEAMMQDLVENATVYRMSADLLRSRFDLIRTAISERV